MSSCVISSTTSQSSFCALPLRTYLRTQRSAVCAPSPGSARSSASLRRGAPPRPALAASQQWSGPGASFRCQSPSSWCALQAAIKHGDYSHLCLRVLCKSGEKRLQMSWGPLRFVDSMNVFPTSLASMIDDLRACTHKQLPELFPLMASLHPEVELRTPTGSPPQRRPLKQRRTHCELEQAWDCILRKLPMPFERGVGDARGVGAALLRQRAGGEGGER